MAVENSKHLTPHLGLQHHTPHWDFMDGDGLEHRFWFSVLSIVFRLMNLSTSMREIMVDI